MKKISRACAMSLRAVFLVPIALILVAASAAAQTPALTSMSPSTVAANSNITVTLNGSNFTSDTNVLFGPDPYPTILTNTFCFQPPCRITVISSTQMTVSILATDIPNPATVLVRVSNSKGTSNGLNLSVVSGTNNPVPTISGLSPTSISAGGSGFTLTVNGSNFVSGSVIQWNGSSRTTTFVSSTQLTAAITTSDIATAGSVQITVVNPVPGGGTSTILTFTISAANPVPTLTSLSPSSATAGGAVFTLTVTGTNFVSTSVVQWNGSPRTTTYISSTQLSISITVTDIATAGTAQITVVNPAPGGGTSTAVSFTINSAVPVGNAVPRLTWVSPMQTTTGGAGVNLTVLGVGYVPGSVVKWNGSSRVTTYVNGNQLTVALTSNDLATAGCSVLTVFNPSPGGGTSNQWGYCPTSPGVTTFPSGTQPFGMGPVSVALDSSLGHIYVLQRSSYYSVTAPLNELNQDIGYPPTDVVSVVDQKTGSVITTVAVGANLSGQGYNQSIAVDSTRHRVYVANTHDNTVSVIDGTTNTTLATVPVSGGPGSIAVDPGPGNGIVYVVGNNVTLLDATTLSVLGSISVGSSIGDITVDPISHLAYVITNIGKAVTVVDGVNQAVRTQLSSGLTLVGYVGIAVDPGLAAIACDGINGWISVFNISGSTPALLKNFSTPGCSSIAVDPSSHLIYATTGSSVNIYSNDGTLQKTIQGLRLATATAIDPSSSRAYVAGAYAAADVNTMSNRLNVLDTTKLSHIGNIVLGTVPNDVVYDASTKRLYVADRLDAIDVIDATTQRVTAVWSSDGGPHHLALDSTLQQLYVCNYTDQTVTVLSTVDGSLKATLASAGGGACNMAVNHTTSLVYAARAGAVTVVNGRTNQVAATIAMSQPNGFAIDEAGGRVYISDSGTGTIQVIDANSNSVAVWKPKNGNVWNLAVDPAVGHLYVVDSNEKFFIGVFTGLEILDTKTGASLAQIASPSMGLFAPSPAAEAIAVNPTTHHVFVSSMGDGTVSVIDGSTNKLLSTVFTGGTFDGWGLTVDPAAGVVYVANAVEASIAVFADQFSATPNPAPKIGQASPANIAAGGGAFTLTITGTNFVPGAVVQWNGTSLPTTFISVTQVTAQVPGTYVASPGNVTVTVLNPPPGGGISLTITLVIYGSQATVASGGIVNNASYTLTSPSLAPGSIASIFGFNLSNGTVCVPPNCGPSFDNTGKAIATLAGAQITFNGIPAPILSTPGNGQLNVQIPVELAGLTTATVVITVNGQAGPPSTVSLIPLSPGLISAASTGSGQGAILNDKDANLGVQSFVAPVGSFPNAHPAAVGDVIEIYATGLGPVTPPVPTGMRPPSLSQTVTTPTVTIGGIQATVVFSGLANCCVGLNQVNVKVPTGVTAGSNVPVVLTIGGVASNTVYIAVQ